MIRIPGHTQPMHAFQRYSIVLTAFVCVVACRDREATRAPASLPAARPSPSAGAAAATGWDSAAGSILVLPLAPDSQRISVVLPGLADSALALKSHFELAAFDDTPVDLFNQDGLVSHGVLRVASQPADVTGCISWPSGRFETAVAPGWKVGFEKGRALGLRLHALSEMHGTDSASFVNDVLRAATQLASTGAAAYHGLPFSVKRGYRVITSSVPHLLLAEVVRQINEEANPREEHTVLVAEENPDENGYAIVFTRRSAGAEESLETTRALAAVRLVREDRPAIVLSLEFEDGSKIGLLERMPNGKWTITWKSAYTGC